MSYTIEWLLTDHILAIVLPVVFDNPVAQAYDRELVERLDKASQPLHLIVDFRPVKVHAGVQILSAWKHTRHPNRGRIVTIGIAGNPVTRFIARLGAQVTRSSLYDVRSFEEACAYLQETEGLLLP